MGKILSIILIILFTVTGCTSGGGSSGSGSSSSSLALEVREDTSITSENGLATFTVVVPERASGMQLVSESIVAGSLSLQAISGPTGTDVMPSTTETGKRLNRKSSSPLAVNIPYANGSLPAGNYQVQIRLTDRRDAGIPQATVSLKAFIKKDSDLKSGTLKVNLVYLGPVAGSGDIRDAVQESIEVMRQVYSRAGILLDLNEYDYEGPGTVQSPAVGDALYSRISQALRPQAVTIVLATDLRGLSSRVTGGGYGEAGSEPGPVIAGPRSAVAISILNVTGNDGRFDFRGLTGSREHNDEKRLLGEEMVRLTANYLGLENIVEFSGNRVASADTLPLSPSCISQQNCKEDASARTNAMLPVPLEKRIQDKGSNANRSGIEYYPRDQWSEDQKLVLNSSIFID